MGTHNISENGPGAWVALCAQPTHTDTEGQTIQQLTTMFGQVESERIILYIQISVYFHTSINTQLTDK